MTGFKGRALRIGVAFLVATVCCVACAGCESDEVKSAKSDLEAEVDRIENELLELQDEIAVAEELAATEETPLDENVIPALESAISEAKTMEFTAPSTPSNLDEINSEIEQLRAIDYTDDVQALKEAETAVLDSVAQMKLVTNPSEAFVIERLQGVEGVGDISAATEENDPNNKLGKDGSYTAAIFFMSPMVDQASVSGDSVIEKGTDGGGAIEVYASAEDARKRDDYLAVFDGTIFSPGSHKVVGTVLVRTSDKLAASQQNQLEEAIVEALTRLG